MTTDGAPQRTRRRYRECLRDRRTARRERDTQSAEGESWLDRGFERLRAGGLVGVVLGLGGYLVVNLLVGQPQPWTWWIVASVAVVGAVATAIARYTRFGETVTLVFDLLWALSDLTL